MSPSKIARRALVCLLGAGSLLLSACGKPAEEKPPAPAQTSPPATVQPPPGPAGGGAKGGGAFDPVAGLLGTTPPAGSPAEQSLLQKHKSALVGVWSADLGKGVTEERNYTAAGTFTVKLTGPAPASASGKYTILGLVGTKGLKIQLESNGPPRTITATFDDDELQHPTLQPGVTGAFRKK